MTMYLIDGKMNSGKTLALTYFALKDYQEGRKIITNYNINIPHYEINKDFLFWMAETQPDTSGMSFFFDEIWLYIDSRSPFANRVLTYFFLQSSKGSPPANVYMTTQNKGQIDVRVRDNAHIEYKCERRVLIENKLRKISNKVRDLGKDIYKYLYIKISESEIKQHSGFMQRFSPADKVYYIKADWIFKFYDTHQKMKGK